MKVLEHQTSAAALSPSQRVDRVSQAMLQTATIEAE